MAQRDWNDTKWICEGVMCVDEIPRDQEYCDTHRKVYNEGCEKTVQESVDEVFHL